MTSQSYNAQPSSPGLSSLSRETSIPIEGFRDLHVSGSEPRIFPGVVSRNQRRDSLAKERNSFSENDDLIWGPRRSKKGSGRPGRDGNVNDGKEERGDSATEEAGATEE